MEYALIAMNHLVKEGACSNREICDKYNLPFEFLSQVLQKLHQENLLNSKRGASGGYSINESKVEQFNFYEFYCIFHQETSLVDCLVEGRDCPLEEGCNIIGPVKKLNQRVKNFYQEISISNLLNAS